MRTIAVDLLRPDLSVLRTEHMTSHVAQFDSYEECLSFVLKIGMAFEKAGSPIIRMKIECLWLISRFIWKVIGKH